MTDTPGTEPRRDTDDAASAPARPEPPPAPDDAWPGAPRPSRGRGGDRTNQLLDAVLNVGRELDLGQVLRRIVEAAVALTGAEYGALGVIGEDRRLTQFIPVGISADRRRQIGDLPRGRGILGELIRHPEPLRLPDLTRHPASHGFPPHHPPMRSFLGVPIRVRGEVFGNLYLAEKSGGRAFDADDEAVVSTLSAAAGVAIGNARVYRLSVRRERWLQVLGEITRSLLSGSGPQEVLTLIAHRALEVAEADTATVLMPTGDPEALRVTVAEGPGAAAATGSLVRVGDSLAGRAARGGRPVVSADLGDDPREPAAHGGDAPHGPAVAVPLPTLGSARGALRLTRRAGRTPFDETEVSLLSDFAVQAALALELGQHRAEVEQLALLHDRDRIARDLHDLAIQRLFATGMTLQSAGPLIEHPEAAERVGRAVDDLDETIKIIRSTIFALRTAERQGPDSLRRRISQAVTRAAGPLGFTPALRIDGPVDTDVPGETAEEVLAVLAEALSNSARHAAARRVDIALTLADRLTLTVADDGVGMRGAAPSGGLLNMRDRAERLGGTLELGPAAEDGTGTRVLWQVPVPGPGPAS